MGYSINNDYKMPVPIAKPSQQKPSREEVAKLAEIYENALERTQAEQKMWNMMQHDGAMKIEAQRKSGHISEEVAQVRQLTNDVMAHDAYARIAAESQQTAFRYNDLKQDYPEYFPNKKRTL